MLFLLMVLLKIHGRNIGTAHSVGEGFLLSAAHMALQDLPPLEFHSNTNLKARSFDPLVFDQRPPRGAHVFWRIGSVVSSKDARSGSEARSWAHHPSSKAGVPHCLVWIAAHDVHGVVVRQIVTAPVVSAEILMIGVDGELSGEIDGGRATQSSRSSFPRVYSHFWGE